VKSERITSQKLIDELFSKTGSQSMVAFPIRVVYRIKDATEGINTSLNDNSPLGAPKTQVLISVPKKHLRHAVDRNRVKRQLREAWRLHRQPLIDRLPESKTLLVAFVWLADRLYDTDEVTHRVKKLIGRIADKL
jgi:ribonuclease P protein component